MALLLLKSVFFPRSKEKAYTLLPSFGQGSRDSSIDENGVRGHESEKDVGEKKKRALSVDPRLIADATIGLSDGLTVPFALTAGLSALGDTNVVIYGGLAELIAGGISMGLGGYLGARGEAQAYQTTLASTRQLIATSPSSAAALAASAFDSYTTISPFLLSSLTSQLSASPSELEDFLMRFHHQLPETAGTASRAYVSAVTIAAGYFWRSGAPDAVLPSSH
ncbi:Protein ccc1 [Taxawa tesnikishii (nom. ined.)]|nr:Protein ccc1 [Dothideales sp. JES 119]